MKPEPIELAKFFPCKVPSDPNAVEDIQEVVRLNPDEVELAQQDADLKTFPGKFPYEQGKLDKALTHCKVSRMCGCDSRKTSSRTLACVQAQD